MSIVAIEKVASYDASLVKAGLIRLLEPLGGMAAFVRPGERVLLKPNMLYGKPPEAAVTTHPAVLQGVIELVQAAGGIALVGDSPGIGALRAVARRSGMLEVVEATGAELVEFSEVRQVASGGVFKRFEVAVPYLDADRVINLPKLKTHEMMTLTCGVKNLFGIVVGAAKPAWHLQAGDDRELFARMLLELYQVRPPDLTIVDAVVAMEGDGPGSGDPRALGLLLAGDNPVAVDTIAGEIAGIPKHLLFVERQAERMGLAGADRRAITTVGTLLDDISVQPFRLPPIADVQFGLPRFLKARLRNQLTTRPVVMAGKCRLCNICVNACPPGAMSVKNGRVEVDYRHCIRCFCCRELCPEAALEVKKGLLLRLLERWKKSSG
jgi:uncharacterized protein (DUF362 family)/Pyruvate/2-oxoacid:ferredoxin oxidoreductase delta subunit